MYIYTCTRDRMHPQAPVINAARIHYATKAATQPQRFRFIIYYGLRIITRCKIYTARCYTGERSAIAILIRIKNCNYLRNTLFTENNQGVEGMRERERALFIMRFGINSLKRRN